MAQKISYNAVKESFSSFDVAHAQLVRRQAEVACHILGQEICILGPEDHERSDNFWKEFEFKLSRYESLTALKG